MKLVEVTLKVHYLTMFCKRGYFDNVISNKGNKDYNRITLEASVPNKHIDDVKKYATHVKIIRDDEAIRSEIEEMKKRISKLEEELSY